MSGDIFGDQLADETISKAKLDLATQIEITSSINAGANLGTGEGQVFAQINAKVFEMRSLAQGVDVSISQSSAEVTIDNTSTLASVLGRGASAGGVQIQADVGVDFGTAAISMGSSIGSTDARIRRTAANIITVDDGSGGPATLAVATLDGTDSLTIGRLGITTRLLGNIVGAGITVSIDSENIQTRDNHLYLNKDYTTTVGQTGGLAHNFLPTATVDTEAAGGFTSINQVETTGAAVFVAGDIVQVSGATNPANDGVYEIASHAANVLTIQGSPTHRFCNTAFVVDAAGSTAAFTQVTVTLMQSKADGVWQAGLGATAAALTASLSNIATVSSVSLAVVLAAGNTTGGTDLLVTSGDRIDSATAVPLLLGTVTATGVTIGRAGLSDGLQLVDGARVKINSTVGGDGDGTLKCQQVTGNAFSGLVLSAPSNILIDPTIAAQILIGTSNAAAVTIGRSGVTTTFTGTTDVTIKDGVITVAPNVTLAAGGIIFGAGADEGITGTGNNVAIYVGGVTMFKVASGKIAARLPLTLGTAEGTFLHSVNLGVVTLGSTAGGSEGTLSLAALGARFATTDVAPTDLVVTGMDAWAQATSGQDTGADLILAAGIGVHSTEVVDFSQTGYTIRVTVSGVATVLTEGVDWTNVTDNATSAGLLATAVSGISGISAVAVGAVVFVTPGVGTTTLLLAETGTGNTVTNKADGSVVISGTTTVTILDGTIQSGPSTPTVDTGLMIAGTIRTNEIESPDGSASISIINGLMIVRDSFNGNDTSELTNWSALQLGPSAGSVDVWLKSGGDGILTVGKTSGATDGTILASGLQSPATAVIATSDGLTTGLIPSNKSVATVTVATDADDIVTLPAPIVGMKIRVYIGGTGCEVRTVAGSNQTINGIDADGTNELALLADSSYVFECTTSSAWVVRGFDAAGADLAALVPDGA